jgi:hypothetical protein
MTKREISDGTLYAIIETKGDPTGTTLPIVPQSADLNSRGTAASRIGSIRPLYSASRSPRASS